MSKISDKVIDEILQRCDIADIIASYIPLKKAGRNFKALCPFHHEKSPSFIVSVDKQIYHCFGCDAGGDVFSFVMNHERMDFPEAVRFLADKVGVAIVDEAQPQAAELNSSASMLYTINELAAEYFYQNLVKDARGLPARQYIASRAIVPESIEKFRLGYSFGLWDGVLAFLRSQGIPEQLMLKSGLVIANAQGKLYDRFRNRVMFPIFNGQGKIIGFGGRILDAGANAAGKDKQPKYINSPETYIYVKSKNLYGINFSKQDIAQSDACIVVEGYLDFIVPFQSGIGNLVASLGTAFTLDHLRLLKRYTQNIIIVFDSDEAGQEAALRSLDLLIEEGMHVRIASLPAGHDPDTYVREHGAAAFRGLVEAAKGLFDFKIERLFMKYDRDVPEEKAFIAAAMLETVKKIKNPILQNTQIQRLAETLSIGEEVIRSELKKMAIAPDIERFREAVVAQQGRNVVPKIAEKMLLSLFFDDMRLVTKAKKILGAEEFDDPIIQKITRYLFANEEEVTPAALLKRINDQQVNAFVLKLLATDLGIKDRKKTFNDCVNKIKKDCVQKQLDRLQKQIHTAQQADRQHITGLLQQYHRLKKEQKSYGKITAN